VCDSYTTDDTPADLGYDLAMPSFTVEQVRAARAFLGWTQVDLGEAAGLSFNTIRNFETSGFPLSPASHAAVRKAFKKAGVEFLKSGKRIGLTIVLPWQDEIDFGQSG
jgi:transcriptional regulator with XRE-family HTH domain